MTAPDCQVQSVNVGEPTALHIGPRPHVSGIDKRPLPGRVQISVDGLAGDHVMDTGNHGGPDQAVYIYTHEDYAYWETELGRPLAPGVFGENLLISGLESAAMRVGDQLDIGGPGGVRLEVTAPRIPCAKLAAHVGEPALVKQFVGVGRPGFYTRVLRGGEVGPGDHVQLIPGPTDAPSIRELFELWYDTAPDLAKLERYLEFPLAVRVRARVQRQLTDAHGVPGL